MIYCTQQNTPACFLFDCLPTYIHTFSSALIRPSSHLFSPTAYRVPLLALCEFRPLQDFLSCIYNAPHFHAHPAFAAVLCKYYSRTKFVLGYLQWKGYSQDLCWAFPFDWILPTHVNCASFDRPNQFITKTSFTLD